MLLGVVEAVPDDELVLDFEPDIVDLHLHQATRGLAQEAGGPQAARGPRVQNILQIGQREPGVDDVLDDHDVLPLDASAQILQ